MISRYTWAEKLTDSWTCRQSINQNLRGGEGSGRVRWNSCQLHLSDCCPATKQFFFCYLADTLVVKETQSLMNVNGVVPVMSSHWAGVVPPTRRGKRRRMSIWKWLVHSQNSVSLTSYTTKQAQSGGVPSEAVEDWVGVALGNRNGHGDGFVELPPARLQGDDGTEGGLVSQGFPHHVHINWLGLPE